MEYMKLKSVVAVAVLAVITGGLFMSCRSMCTNVKSVSGCDLEKFLGECGDNLNLLWILSRTPEIPDDVKENYLNIARQIGYDVDKLVWTIQ